MKNILQFVNRISARIAVQNESEVKYIYIYSILDSG